MARPRRSRLELAAQGGEIDAEVLRFCLVLRPPDLLEQLPLRYELALVADEHFEDVPLRGREAYRGPVACDLLGREVDAEVVGLDDRIFDALWSATERGADAGEKLLHAERLGDV